MSCSISRALLFSFAYFRLFLSIWQPRLGVELFLFRLRLIVGRIFGAAFQALRGTSDEEFVDRLEDVI